MREIITLTEAVARRPWKPLAQITGDDLRHAFQNDPDLIHIIANHSQAYPGYANEDFTDRLAEARRRLGPVARSKEVEVYRGLKSLNLSLPIGNHWTVDKHITDDFGEVRAVARVTQEHIDWASTVARNIVFDYAESEIVLMSGATVVIDRFEFTDGFPMKVSA